MKLSLSTLSKERLRITYHYRQRHFISIIYFIKAFHISVLANMTRNMMFSDKFTISLVNMAIIAIDSIQASAWRRRAAFTGGALLLLWRAIFGATELGQQA